MSDWYSESSFWGSFSVERRMNFSFYSRRSYPKQETWKGVTHNVNLKKLWNDFSIDYIIDVERLDERKVIIEGKYLEHFEVLDSLTPIHPFTSSLLIPKFFLSNARQEIHCFRLQYLARPCPKYRSVYAEFEPL